MLNDMQDLQMGAQGTVARLWRWQWPKALIFLVPSKRKRIEPTQCHLNSRNLPSPHRPTGEERPGFVRKDNQLSV